ncbi:phage major capsid protein, P2 family [Comamonas odontotermitis]|uniref:phage major capsid protein, P2 family n=1 Tax=Comamonas odontotermitis TaxID=379895 RepID=UPI003670D654
MKNDTRLKFNAYVAQQALLSGIADATKMFAIAPSVQQTLEKRIQESSAFLGRINIAPVDELMGERLGLGVSGPIASRTDTSGDEERKPVDVSDLNQYKYLCAQTNYDTAIRYAKLDMWAKFPEFQKMLSAAIIQQCALDRMMIGFNGVSAAANTNRAANPLLQDVNKGWLQDLRENAPARVMKEGQTAGKIKIGVDAAGKKLADADYASLDGAVYDARHNLIAAQFAESADLVAIVGRDLMHDKLFPIVDGQTAPTEMLAGSLVVSQKRLGGLTAVTVPFFPPKAVMITSLDNLSIYYQASARRRMVMEQPHKDRIATFESSNDAFVIENLDKACLLENIELA